MWIESRVEAVGFRQIGVDVAQIERELDKLTAHVNTPAAKEIRPEKDANMK
jgi:hypothetical protein